MNGTKWEAFQLKPPGICLFIKLLYELYVSMISKDIRSLATFSLTPTYVCFLLPLLYWKYKYYHCRVTCNAYIYYAN